VKQKIDTGDDNFSETEMAAVTELVNQKVEGVTAGLTTQIAELVTKVAELTANDQDTDELINKAADILKGGGSCRRGGRETGEEKKSEGPGRAGALTWWGLGDVRGVSFFWRSCPSHRRAPPLTLPLSRLMSGAGGSGPDSWFRLRAGY
jgi:hypothetical protein